MLEAISIDDCPNGTQSGSVALCIEAAPAGLVLLQTLIESYEGIGLVRTLDPERSLLCILCTNDTVEICKQILISLQSQLPWKAALFSAEELQQAFKIATKEDTKEDGVPYA